MPLANPLPSLPASRGWWKRDNIIPRQQCLVQRVPSHPAMGMTRGTQSSHAAKGMTLEKHVR